MFPLVERLYDDLDLDWNVWDRGEQRRRGHSDGKVDLSTSMLILSN